MGEEREQQENRRSEGEPRISSDNPSLHEEAVADPLKVKRPEKAKPKKAQSRERKKRNVGPFE
ncbi:MAG: hypothetical protein ACRDGO_03030 [Actinomycetota bacterium]